VTTPSNANPQDQSIGELFVDVSKDISLLIRQEVELAKAELRESATTASKGAGELGGAAVAAHLGLVFLSIALWWGLGYAFNNNAWSAVVVAVLWGIIGAILYTVGRKKLKEVQGAPQTVDTIKEIPEAFQRNEENR